MSGAFTSGRKTKKMSQISRDFNKYFSKKGQTGIFLVFLPDVNVLWYLLGYHGNNKESDFYP